MHFLFFAVQYPDLPSVCDLTLLTLRPGPPQIEEEDIAGLHKMPAKRHRQAMQASPASPPPERRQSHPGESRRLVPAAQALHCEC